MAIRKKRASQSYLQRARTNRPEAISQTAFHAKRLNTLLPRSNAFCAVAIRQTVHIILHKPMGLRALYPPTEYLYRSNSELWKT
eukprot:3205329-Amphidinium_carterae.1